MNLYSAKWAKRLVTCGIAGLCLLVIAYHREAVCDAPPISNPGTKVSAHFRVYFASGRLMTVQANRCEFDEEFFNFYEAQTTLKGKLRANKRQVARFSAHIVAGVEAREQAELLHVKQDATSYPNR